MLDIRSAGFLSCPQEQLSELIKQGTVGVVGSKGFVGRATAEFFKENCTVLKYDIAGSENTLSELVQNSELIFLCLPTPMREDGSCHTDIIDSVIGEIRTDALACGRPLDSSVIVVKSTVPVGFTDELREKYFPMRITFSPEFLTEKNAIEDFKRCNRVIVAGDQDDASVVLAFFCGVLFGRASGEEEKKVLSKYLGLLETINKDQYSNLLLLFNEEMEVAKSKRVVLYHEESASVAELSKLFINAFLATKVTFCNEIYQLCEKLGIVYDEVIAAALLDRRIGDSHVRVPGHDGFLSYGGTCFPKDINNLIHFCKEVGVSEKLFTASWLRNKELRNSNDWQIEGRSVLKKTKD